MTTMPFTKVVGTGNDFVIIDNRRHRFDALNTQWKAVSRSLCDRHDGVGADGVLLLESSNVADVRMRVFNPDGTEAEMCGNGARCVGLYLKETRDKRQGTGHGRITIESLAGVLSASVRRNRVAMRMMDPTELTLGVSVPVGRRRLRLGFVNTGVPHAVVPVPSVDAVNVQRVGGTLRYHRHFAPRGTNVNFIQRRPGASHRIKIRTYERGVEEETLACGTGVVASAIIYALTTLSRTSHGQVSRNGHVKRFSIDVETRSQDRLTVSFAVLAGGRHPQVTDVVLEGDARVVFEGSVEWPKRRGG